jgi:hypothetical protein
METLELTSYAIGAGAALVAALLKLYTIGYARGYDDGKHCGFTQGLYAAAKREDRRKRSQGYLQPS